MTVTASMVKELRQMSGAGMMDCKKALVEHDGNVELAMEYLQKKGIAAAEKKSSRIAAEGLVAQWVSGDNKKGVLVEVNCETDFVSRNDQFIELVEKVTNSIGSSDATTVEEAMALTVAGQNMTEFLNDAISTIGEKIQIRRFERLDEPDGFVEGYLHAGSQIGVMVKVKGSVSDDAAQFAKDVSMHIAAMNPGFLSTDDITEADSAKQEEIFTAMVVDSGKPAEIAPKIVKGKMGKWKREQSLLAQAFVKDSKLSVQQYQDKVGGVQLVSFHRYAVGEGIEKKVDNLAEEVAATLKG